MRQYGDIAAQLSLSSGLLPSSLVHKPFLRPNRGLISAPPSLDARVPSGSAFLLSAPQKPPADSASHIHLQCRDQRLLRNVDLAELPHALFAFLLLVEQLAFARGVAAVTFGGDVLAEGARGLVVRGSRS